MLTVGRCVEILRARFPDEVRWHREFGETVARLHGRPPPAEPRITTGKDLGRYLINVFEKLGRSMEWGTPGSFTPVFALIEEMLTDGDDEVKSAAGAFLDECASAAAAGEMPCCGPYLGAAAQAYFRNKSPDTR